MGCLRCPWRLAEVRSAEDRARHRPQSILTRETRLPHDIARAGGPASQNRACQHVNYGEVKRAYADAGRVQMVGPWTGTLRRPRESAWRARTHQMHRGTAPAPHGKWCRRRGGSHDTRPVQSASYLAGTIGLLSYFEYACFSSRLARPWAVDLGFALHTPELAGNQESGLRTTQTAAS